jgi:hypothetical protein
LSMRDPVGGKGKQRKRLYSPSRKACQNQFARTGTKLINILLDNIMTIIDIIILPDENHLHPFSIKFYMLAMAL